MVAETEAIAGECLLEVASDANHYLSFASRRRLLLSIGPPGLMLDESWNFRPAHRIRAMIAYVVAKRTLPIWSSEYDARHPYDMVDSCAFALFGEGASIPPRELRRRAYQFDGALLDGASKEKRRSLYAARATVCSAFVCAGDELLVPDAAVTEAELEDPQDPDLWDCAAWAAAASSGDFPWSDDGRFDAVESRRFWTWYLETVKLTAKELSLER